jgi:hypothetical protein
MVEISQSGSGEGFGYSTKYVVTGLRDAVLRARCARGCRGCRC